VQTHQRTTVSTIAVRDIARDALHLCEHPCKHQGAPQDQVRVHEERVHGSLLTFFAAAQFSTGLAYSYTKRASLWRKAVPEDPIPTSPQGGSRLDSSGSPPQLKQVSPQLKEIPPRLKESYPSPQGKLLRDSRREAHFPSRKDIHREQDAVLSRLLAILKALKRNTTLKGDNYV
jgi:hypothetical protein